MVVSFIHSHNMFVFALTQNVYFYHKIIQLSFILNINYFSSCQNTICLAFRLKIIHAKQLRLVPVLQLNYYPPLPPLHVTITDLWGSVPASWATTQETCPVPKVFQECALYQFGLMNKDLKLLAPSYNDLSKTSVDSIFLLLLGCITCPLHASPPSAIYTTR